MLTVKTIVEPNANIWEAVVKGMRLPFKSGERNDSDYCYGDTSFAWHSDDLCQKCPYYEKANVNPDDEDDFEECCHYDMGNGFPTYVLGKNDLNLFMRLCTEGDPSHRKLLRQLPVHMEINAPLYWWKQMDQYKVGTTTNSESTMHTLTKYSFTSKDFSLGKLDDTDYYIESGHLGIELNNYVSTMLEMLESLRDRYIETNNAKYWDALNKLLPQSYNQTRMWSGSYETCVSIIKNRIDHDLDEWRSLIVEMLKRLHMLYPVVEALGIVRTEGDNIEYWSTRDKREGEWVTLCKRKDIPACEQFAYPDSEESND